MADVLISVGNGLKKTLKDMGDGTYAELVAALLSAGESHVGAVGGHTFRSEVEMSRPADTNNYTANDAVTNNATTTTPMNFANCARVVGGGVTLLTARLVVDKASFTARFRLWLYRDTPASPPADNAAFSQTYANSSLRIGYVDFLTPLSGSDCTDYYGALVYVGPTPIVPVGTSIYGLLQTLDAITNTSNSGAKFKVTLCGYQD